MLNPGADEDSDQLEMPGRPMAHARAVRQLSPLLDDIAEALVGVATSSVKGVIDNMVPGFREQLARIEERSGR
jgi:hypothetical protein